MSSIDFAKFSLKCRYDFLNILSNTKERFIEMLPRGYDASYLREINNAYKNYLHTLFDTYTKENNVALDFDTIVYDFISTIDEQCEDPTFISKNERCLHITSIEYNMIIDIHKFAYELYSSNNDVCERDFFHGTCLTELLSNNEITVEKFREESFYDIDNFNHIDIKNDIEYLVKTTMMDIYLLNILSDVMEYENYNDFFAIVYTLKNKGLVDKDLYRYLLTMEDVLYAKKGIAKNISYTIIIIAFITSIMILFAYYLKG